MTSPQPISSAGLSQLNRGEIRAVTEIRRVLLRARDLGIWLTSGMDLSVRPRRAQITEIDEDGLTLRGENLDTSGRQLHLNLEMGDARYFFAGMPAGSVAKAGDFRLRLPTVLYRAERRDIPRVPVANEPISLLLANGRREKALITDRSYEGLGVRVGPSVTLAVGADVAVQGGGDLAGAYAQVRYSGARSGWRQLGLAVSKVPPSKPIPVESRVDILKRTPNQRRWATLGLATRAALTAPRIFAERRKLVRRSLPAVELVEYQNRRGERIRGIVTRVGKSEGAPLILVPPAWGRTKETLLPLVETIASTFSAAGESVSILRYDERNRRGESFVDLESKAAGEDGLNYTFSGAVEDIHTSLEFARTFPTLKPSSVVLVTLSLASIQGRRAMATDPTGLLSGWISLVGMPDLQSSMRAVTGGIDWIYGLTQGIRFGKQELVGVLVDMDNAGPDTLKHHLGYFEDARRDMARIKVPIVWIHGLHDGWMSVERVQELMSCGDTSERKLLEVPTGHQLRTSAEALDAFQLVAQEVSEIVIGRRLEPHVPDLARLESLRAAERARRPRADVNLREFWHDYLLGHDETVGMELMSATTLYREFLDKQIAALSLADGASVLDLGAGTGELAVRLGERAIDCQVTAVDFIPAALKRATTRASRAGVRSFRPIVADLGAAIPIARGEYDAILASLVVSYLDDAGKFLGDALRLLRPGGRIAISAPRRDADISKLFTDTISERFWDHLAGRFGDDVISNFEAHQAEFLNNAAKVLELEDDGRFRFYDPKELEALLRSAGCRKIGSSVGFGSPGQFAIAWGVR